MWHDSASPSRRLEETERVRLPTPGEFAPRKGALLPDDGFFYIKLHGSQDWLSFNGERQMVLGRGKQRQIEGEPLLKEYLEVFREVLFAGDRELLLIGYGFGDEHINQTIAEAVTNHGLKLYILSPQSPGEAFKSFRQPIMGQFAGWPMDEWKNHMGDIWSGLAGYFPYHLTKMLPGHTKTPDWQTVLEHFFGEVS